MSINVRKAGSIVVVMAILVSVTAFAGGRQEEAPVSPAVPDTELVVWADAGRAPVLERFGERFTAEYGVPVVVQQMGFGDVRDQLKVAGPAGEGPDIIIGAHDWLGELVENGLLEPMDLGPKATRFDPVALNAFTYEGTLYGMPYNTEAIALYYNRQLVPEPPATWDELEAIARTLQEAGRVDQGYVLQVGDPYHTYPLFTAFGGYVFGTDGDGSYDPADVGLDSPGAIEAARRLDRMVKEGLLRDDVDWEIMMNLFHTERSAMLITGPWALTAMRESGVDYGVAKIPAGTREARPFVGVQGFMINSFSENKVLAASFLTDFMATDEAMSELYEALPNAPAWLPLQGDVDDEDLAVFASSAADGDPMPAIPEMSAVWEAWSSAIVLVFQQQQDPAEAMRDAAHEVRERISRREN